MISVFDITEEFRRLNEMAYEYDSETGELLNSDEEIQILARELEGKKEDKLENIEYLKRENKAHIEALKQEAKRLQDKAKSLENTNKRLVDLQDMLLDGEKLKTSRFSFGYRKSESVEVSDDANINSMEDYVKVAYTWDKKALKDALKSGLKFDGIKLVEKHSVSVR